MAQRSKYCEYGCDYMCNVCLQKEMEAERNALALGGVPKIPHPFNPLSDDTDDNAMGWMGYGHSHHAVDEYGELTGFPLTRFTEHGTPTTTTTSYVPPPMKLLKGGTLLQIDEEPVVAESPNKLVKGEIIT